MKGESLLRQRRPNEARDAFVEALGCLEPFEDAAAVQQAGVARAGLVIAHVRVGALAQARQVAESSADSASPEMTLARIELMLAEGKRRAALGALVSLEAEAEPHMLRTTDATRRWHGLPPRAEKTP